MNPAVELVSTGSELLTGRTLNRHAQVLGGRLRDVGLELVRDTTVGDRLGDIQDAVRSALQRADIVVVSGGLGPTSDDLTPEAVAALLQRRVVTDEASLAAVRARYKKMERVVSPSAERQARVVEGAVALPNSVGAAPGERMELGGKVIFILPGPPPEFRAVLEEHVLPWLTANVAGRNLSREALFMVCGVGESDIVTLFEKFGFNPMGVEMAYCAGPRRIEVRCRATSASGTEWAGAVRRIREMLAPHIFSETREEMEDVVGQLLRGQRKTLATAESCTGGLLGERITAISGSSAYYLGGIIAYANQAKQDHLGVSPEQLEKDGAVSPGVAGQMAEQVRARFGADFGLGVTGIAGPTGGTADKPVGLVFIALADQHSARVRQYRFGGNRERIREWASQMALDMLRRRLQQIEILDTFGVACSL